MAIADRGTYRVTEGSFEDGKLHLAFAGKTLKLLAI